MLSRETVLSVRRPVLAIVVAAGLLAGCGGGSTSSAGGTSSDGGTTGTASAPTSGGSEATDLCPLITAADMSALLGYEVAFKRDPSNGCSYDSVKADARTEPSVGIASILLVDGAGDFAGTKSGATAAAQGVAVDLPGVGDMAFTVTSGEAAGFNIGQAIALVGGQVITVSVTGGGEAGRAKLAPTATEVLKLAVSKV